MRIAVVGSGIAGLSAAWLLSQDHEVTIFEKSARLGMDAHGLDIAGLNGEVRIDVPLRVFFDGFYPNLVSLYHALGIDSQPINYSASFGQLNERSYFRYENYKFGRYTLPFFKGKRSVNPMALRIGWDIFRFFRQLPTSLANGITDELTLEDYLRQRGYSREFAEGFLYPAFAGICTCSHASIRDYPARVVLEYLDTGLLFSSVRRVTQGTQEIVRRLAAAVHQIHFNTEVQGLIPNATGVTLDTPAGSSSFDHVVLATQANQSAKLLNQASTEERDVMNAFCYEPSRVIVHRDARLAPPGGPPEWAPVNFLLGDNQAAPMATIWMNAIQSLPARDPLFQSWNPIIDPNPALVLAESTFERPVVNFDSLQALKRLNFLHQKPDRRLWFCGSYAAHGIPLLESATHSALSVAERLGSRRPWTTTGRADSGAHA